MGDPPARRLSAFWDLLWALAAASAVALLARVGGANATTAGFLFLLGVLGVASRRGLVAGLCSSLLSALAYNFFFFPPYYTFTIAEPANWVALVAFAGAAVISGRLLAAARRRAEEAESRRRETQILYDLCFGLFAATNRPDGLAADLGRTVAALGATGAELSLEDGVGTRRIRIGEEAGTSPAIPLEIGGDRMGELRLRGAELPEPLLASAGRLVALAIERERLIAESAAAEALAASDRSKTALLRAVSHDLRSPLTAMALDLEGVLRGLSTDSPARERLLAVERERERLDRRVGNLLAAARLEAGLLHPAREPTPPAELLHRATDHLSRILAGRLVAYRVEVEVPDVLVDPPLIDEVLVNLIDNAARLSPPETPIELAAAAEVGGASVVLDVLDRGPGPPEGWQEGTRGGLGLAIARQLAAACGGEVELHAREGGGTRARIRLPAAAAATVET